MTKSTESVAGEFADELAAVREGVATLTERLTKLVREQAPSAGQRISDFVGEASDKIASTTADAQKTVCSAGREIEACIEKKPLTSVLVAFGVGVSLGLLSRLRG